MCFLICISSLTGTKQWILCSLLPSSRFMLVDGVGWRVFIIDVRLREKAALPYADFLGPWCRQISYLRRDQTGCSRRKEVDRWRKTEGDNERSWRRPVDTAGRRRCHTHTKKQEGNKDSPEERGKWTLKLQENYLIYATSAFLFTCPEIPKGT